MAELPDPTPRSPSSSIRTRPGEGDRAEGNFLIEIERTSAVAHRIARAAATGKGLVLSADEAWRIATHPGANDRVRAAARRRSGCRLTADETQLLADEPIRDIAMVLDKEIENRHATGRLQASLLDVITVTDVVQNLEGSDYRFAKTMPRIPHWYVTVDSWRGPLGYHLICGAIWKFGTRERWGPYNHPYLYANGWKYWVMSDDKPEDVPIPTRGSLINRARSERRHPFDGLTGSPVSRALDTLAGKVTPTGQTLDVGCGTGRLIDLSGLPPHRYTGIDASSRMVSACCEAHPTYADRIRHAALHDFWTALRYDTVVALGSASYLTPAELDKAWELVAPGGRLCVAFLEEPVGCPHLFHQPMPVVEGMSLTATGDGLVVGEVTKPAGEGVRSQ